MSYSVQLYMPNYFEVNKSNNQINSNLIRHEQRKLKLNQMPDDTFVIIMGSYLYYLEKDIVFKNDKIEIVENERNIKFVEKKNIDLNYDERIAAWKKSLKKNLINILKNKKVLLVYPVPKPPKNILRHIKKNYKKFIFNNYYLKIK